MERCGRRQMSDSDDEIERINRKKLEEIMTRKRVQEAQPMQSPDVKPILLTDSNFLSEVSKYRVTVVDFWAAWCGPCRMVSPLIEQLASEYAGRVAFGKLNVDENPMISTKYGVQSIPTILVFKSGKQVDGLVGAVPKSYIENKFKPYLDNDNPDSIYH